MNDMFRNLVCIFTLMMFESGVSASNAMIKTSYFQSNISWSGFCMPSNLAVGTSYPSSMLESTLFSEIRLLDVFIYGFK